MERRKRAEPGQWLPPGAFLGTANVQEAVGQIQFSKRIETGGGSPPAAQEPEMLERLQAEVTSLREELDRLKDEWARWTARWRTAEERASRERERLAHMVLMLKREWEAGRHEHRDC